MQSDEQKTPALAGEKLVDLCSDEVNKIKRYSNKFSEDIEKKVKELTKNIYDEIKNFKQSM